MKHNGTEVKSMTYNGHEVNSWVHNGVEVYSSRRLLILDKAYVGEPPTNAYIYAYILIDGVTDFSASTSTELLLPKGTVINCVIRRGQHSDYYGASSDITRNGSTVFTDNSFSGTWGTYKYILTKNARISTSTWKTSGVALFCGTIEITEY